METMTVPPQKMILNLEKLNELNGKGYAGKFALGDTVVLACGGWEGGPRWIHEREAVFDRKSNAYIERKCYQARKIND